jgi:hypothetical protein
MNQKHEEFLFDIYEFVKRKFRNTGVIVPSIYFIRNEECTEITPIFFIKTETTIDQVREIMMSEDGVAFIFCGILAENDMPQQGEIRLKYSVILQYSRFNSDIATIIKGSIDMKSISIFKTDVQKDVKRNESPLPFNPE